MKKTLILLSLLVSTVSIANDSVSGEFLKCNMGPYGSSVSFEVVKLDDGTKHFNINTSISDHLNMGSANGAIVSISTYSNQDKQTQFGIDDLQQVGDTWIMYGNDKNHTKFSITMKGSTIKVDSKDSRVRNAMIAALASEQSDKSTQVQCSTTNN